MKREASPVRPQLAQELAEIGFRDSFDDGAPYWDESVRYVFRLNQIEDDIEKAAEELHALCLSLVADVVRSERALRRLCIPEHAWDLIAESWRRRDPSLYGRFDFAYDGRSPPRLLEYNADTPTALYEAAVVQWRWLEQLMASGDLPDDADQFTSAHEKLIARFAAIGGGEFLHLACMAKDADSAGTLAYLADCAMRVTQFVEPPWKMILQCKGALALLWEKAPHHPNLLECYFEAEREAALLTRYARKPLYSREGADIELKGDGEVLRGAGDGYGAEGFVRQALRPLPEFDGRYPVVGAWIVGDEPAGMGVREDSTPLTGFRARFVPHVIVE